MNTHTDPSPGASAPRATPTVGRALAPRGFPSRRTTRLALLLLMPGAVLCGLGVPTWAQSLRRWVDGETLTADALNNQFDVLTAQIDGLRWGLLHAAAAGACAGEVGTEGAANAIPKPVGQTCSEVCASGDSSCLQSVSVGPFVAERATSRLSVGSSSWYECDDEPDGPIDPGGAAFDESTLTDEQAPARLTTGLAQYCCCGTTLCLDGC